MKTVCKKCNHVNAWYPTEISILESYLSRFIMTGYGIHNLIQIRKNIAHSIQYLQFQSYLLDNFELRPVSRSQTYKTYVIVGSSILESFLHFLLIRKNVQQKEEWGMLSKKEFETTIDKNTVCKNTIKVLQKLEKPKSVDMTFDIMLKIASKHKIIKAPNSFYKNLEDLRLLRNKIHLQGVGTSYDVDWFKFTENEYKLIKRILHTFFYNTSFSPSEDDKKIFDFLL